jgi:hypothetical protein
MLHRVHAVDADDEAGLRIVKVTYSTGAPLIGVGIGDTEDTFTRSAPCGEVVELAMPLAAHPRLTLPAISMPAITENQRWMGAPVISGLRRRSPVLAALCWPVIWHLRPASLEYPTVDDPVLQKCRSGSPSRR